MAGVPTFAIFLLLFFFVGCSQTREWSGRCPAETGSDNVCTQPLLGERFQSKDTISRQRDFWEAQDSIVFESPLPANNERERRIFAAAENKENLRRLAELFRRAPRSEIFERFAKFVRAPSVERLRLALLAEEGLDLADAKLSDPVAFFLKDLTINLFPGERLLPNAKAATDSRFLRFFPAYHDAEEVYVFRIESRQRAESALQTGLAAPARLYLPGDLGQIETSFLRRPEVFYPIARGGLLSGSWEEKISPIIPAVLKLDQLKDRISNALEGLNDASIEGFSVYRLDAKDAISMSESGDKNNFVYCWGIEKSAIQELWHFRNEGDSVVGLRMSRSRTGTIQKAATSLAEIFRSR